jgi:hypothetical protein
LKISLWASGIPSSGPRRRRRRSVAFAAFSALSASTARKALMMGCHTEIRARQASVSSCADACRRCKSDAASASVRSPKSLNWVLDQFLPGEGWLGNRRTDRCPEAPAGSAQVSPQIPQVRHARHPERILHAVARIEAKRPRRSSFVPPSSYHLSSHRQHALGKAFPSAQDLSNTGT